MVSILVFATAAASSEGHKASIMDVHPGLTFWTIVTFAIVAVVLSKFVFKPIVATLEQREKTIRETIEEAKKERVEAERLLIEQKKAITEARREASELIRKNQAEVESARQTAIEQANKDAEAMLAQARRTIEDEKTKAIAEVKLAAVDLAVAAAGKLLETNLDEKRQRDLAEDFLRKLPAQPRA